MTGRRTSLPAVDRVLRSEGGDALIARYGRPLALDAVRKALAERRRSGADASVVSITEASATALARTMQPSQRRVFNLTGTVLHTNLGRAVAEPAQLVNAPRTAIGGDAGEQAASGLRIDQQCRDRIRRVRVASAESGQRRDIVGMQRAGNAAGEKRYGTIERGYSFGVEYGIHI